jgi:hypothetical protein
MLNVLQELQSLRNRHMTCMHVMCCAVVGDVMYCAVLCCAGAAGQGFRGASCHPGVFSPGQQAMHNAPQ